MSDRRHLPIGVTGNMSYISIHNNIINTNTGCYYNNNRMMKVTKKTTTNCNWINPIVIGTRVPLAPEICWRE